MIARPGSETSMSPTPQNGLIEPADRQRLLDALRGFALLGILLANIPWFNRPLSAPSLRIDPGDGPAGVAAWAVHVFVEGKFWLLFATLFGVGFAMMQQRLESKGQDFVSIQWRRSLALICFGLVHAVLLWPGDVLMTYGLSAVILLAFQRMPDSVWWKTGLGLYVSLALLLLTIGGLISRQPAAVVAAVEPEMQAAAISGAERLAAVEAIYREGSYLAVTGQRWRELFETAVPNALLASLWVTLGAFLLGGWLWRHGPLRNPGLHRRFWVRSFIGAALLGAPMAMLSLSFGTQFDAGTNIGHAIQADAWMMLANLPLALLWLSAFVLLWQTPIGERALAWLAPAGRMALTHYLSQSLICSLLFFGYGLGWYGQLDRLALALIAMTLCVAQWWVSPLWLSAFHYGPMEWAWRALSYGERPPLRRARPV